MSAAVFTALEALAFAPALAVFAAAALVALAALAFTVLAPALVAFAAVDLTALVELLALGFTANAVSTLTSLAPVAFTSDLAAFAVVDFTALVEVLALAFAPTLLALTDTAFTTSALALFDAVALEPLLPLTSSLAAASLAAASFAALRCNFWASRRSLKNDDKIEEHLSSKTPPITWMWWLWRVSSEILNTDPQAPVLGSLVPYTIVEIRAWIAAIIHMQHGSKVTYMVSSFKR